ncbi:MAG TPA: tetratricopeptide repeat protein [Nitrospirota bacterium]|nr:tetratricopeptide repeat protein [Nitrospirota bacterium]
MNTQLQNNAQQAVSRWLPYFKSPLVHGALIIILCLAAYSNTFHVPFQFDDPRSISEVPFVRDIHQFPNLITQQRAVGFLTFALDYWFHGTDVVGYHIVNLVIHILNAFLVYALVILSFRTPVLKESQLTKHAKPIALFSALLFAGHPIQTQAVTYIAQRFASLATFFFLLSLVAYVWSRIRDVTNPSNYRALIWYGVSLLSAVLAMKTKEIAFTLPVVIALYEFLFLEGAVKKRILLLLPLLLTMIIIPLTLLGTARPLGDMLGDIGEVTKLQTNVSRGEYLITEFTVIVTYLRLLFFPVNQNLDYDYPVFKSFFVPEVVFSFLLLLLILGIAIYLVYHDRRSPGAGRLTAFGIFWFFITLSVESSVIPIADVIFEHRLYLPSVGFFIAVTSALFWGGDWLRARWAKAEQAVVIALAAAAVLFASIAYARNIVWKSEESLWEDVIRKSPMKARGYNGLGLAYFNKGNYDKAIDAFGKAIALHPAYGVAFNNIGNSYFRVGHYNRAIEAQTEAIALEPNNAIFYDNRGLSYAGIGAYDRAIDDFSKAISLDPTYAKSYHNLGFAYHSKGMYGPAIEEYAKAIALDPGNAIFRSNRGSAYAANGEYERAIKDQTAAIALDPDLAAAYNGRGTAHGLQGRYDEAIADFTKAISLDPGNSLYYAGRGVAFLRASRRTEALADFEHACNMGNKTGCRGVMQLKDYKNQK